MNSPGLSLIVVAFDMPQQLENTVYSLSEAYQRGVDSEDYEVLVIENVSENTLSESFVKSLPSNFSYHLRQEQSQSPAAAVNYGLQMARGEVLGIMIDGAHLLSPGVISHAISLRKISKNFLLTIPTYHMGPAEQHLSTQQGYTEEIERDLLSSSEWKKDGYQLFSISSWCGANPRGYFAPIMESNCYFAPRQAFEEIGGVDMSFQQAGGGALNLHILRELGIRREAEFFTCAGEGSFHQFHGGITSNVSRENYEEKFNSELQQHWNNQYHFLERNPTIIGSIKPQAIANMKYSVQKMQRRFENCRANQWQVWSDD